MAPSERGGPSDQIILREVSTVLRLADDPDQMTFKQVRLAVEKSLGLPEGSLHKSSTAKIKDAVHTVMDELDQEAAAEEKEEEEEEGQEEEEEDFEGVRPFEASTAEAPPSRIKKWGRIGIVSGSADLPTAKRVGKTSASSEEQGEKKAAKVGGNTKKKTKAESGGGEEDNKDGMVCVLSETASARRQVSVEKWKGRPLVHIREHYRKAQERFAPSKKGVALTRAQWEALRSATQRIDRAVDKLSYNDA